MKKQAIIIYTDGEIEQVERVLKVGFILKAIRNLKTAVHNIDLVKPANRDRQAGTETGAAAVNRDMPAVTDIAAANSAAESEPQTYPEITAEQEQQH